MGKKHGHRQYRMRSCTMPKGFDHRLNITGWLGPCLSLSTLVINIPKPALSSGSVCFGVAWRMQHFRMGLIVIH